ncbi:MAG: benzoate-CoA ligase family protein [Actinomycetota bacterium]|nr:benzoate-CoA ligase family protein [Actinomycetota bacterium]
MPDLFNVTTYLLHRHVEAGDGGRTAVRSAGRSLTYGELAEHVDELAAGFRSIGLRREERVLFVAADGVGLLAGILAVMALGAVAVPVSTMLTGKELTDIVRDSRARVLVVGAEFVDAARVAVADAPDLADVVLCGSAELETSVTTHRWDDLVAAGREAGPPPAPSTWDDSPALWLYTSGTTGFPKAAMHRHANFRHVAQTYAHQVLGIRRDDVCYSVAKLFFAYGLGNSMIFPMSVGACTVLDPARPTPAAVRTRVTEDRPTLFYGVPTFYAAMLAAEPPADTFASVRQATSAGEALPARLLERFRERFGVEILDGIGSTEALHIFISNRPGDVRPGTSGFPVPGWDISLRDEHGAEVPDGSPGSLYIRGPSLANGYWCRTDTSRAVFQGEWQRTGDTYVRGEDGAYQCLGRSGDMLKAGGMWVSPAEVEARLLEHPSVAEVAVVGVADADGLDKPVACVVAATGTSPDPEELIAYCREGLAAFKRPRTVLVVAQLPKTATGKLKRYQVREFAAGLVRPGSTGADEQVTPT